ncbi:MAG TPA: helix-turn-helix domain-containing protein [Symbiobacteriaceae bacterium]
MTLVQRLIELGLSDNEARAYAVLLLEGAMTGYEVARRSSIARGNVYACLARLVDKQAVVRTSEDQFAPVPLEQFARVREESIRSAAAAALAETERLQHNGGQAQVLTVIGTEAILERARTILQAARSAVFIASFPEELAALAPDLGAARERGLPIEALSFGVPPAAWAEAACHAAADDIRTAQGGRLFMLSAAPEGLVAVLDSSATCAGIWSWNRYLASAVGLYVAHERFLIRLWDLLPDSVRDQIRKQLTDLSSRIALAGAAPGEPLLSYLVGNITPAARLEEEENNV